MNTMLHQFAISVFTYIYALYGHHSIWKISKFLCNIHAVKLLDWGEDGFATEAETAALRTSFKQEVAVWHKLSHPNVTKVHNFHLPGFSIAVRLHACLYTCLCSKSLY
jgi:hypothetical protein